MQTSSNICIFISIYLRACLPAACTDHANLKGKYDCCWHSQPLG